MTTAQARRVPRGRHPPARFAQAISRKEFAGGFRGARVASWYAIRSPKEARTVYGNAIADVSACALALAAASTNGVLRIMADQHWPTDVAASIVIGLGTGYGIPYLLHYRNGRPEALASSLLPSRTVLLPMASDRVLGIRWMGLF